MVVTRLQGGLGNQMFQYAVVFAIARNVFLDLEFLKSHAVSTDSFTRRNFELSIFPNIKYKEASNFRKDIFFSKKIIPKIIRKLLKARVIKQQENEYIPISGGNIYFDGYFQSEKYFINKRQKILNVFQFPEVSIKNQLLQKTILETEDSISLHIRRGDYLKPEVIKYHGILPITYYHSALEIITKKFPENKIFIFSDDYQFSKDNFGRYENCTIIEGNSERAWEDMALMSLCTHHIIANSSFSWWGAWLSQKRGITIAPKNWFNKEVANFDIDNIVPDHWIKI